MAKLYNNLGLKMMERRKHEEALGLVRQPLQLLSPGHAVERCAVLPTTVLPSCATRPARCCPACSSTAAARCLPLPAIQPPNPAPDPTLQLRKAEAVVDSDAVWQGPGAEKRARMRAITYNNLGCLFKRRNMPQLALQVGSRAGCSAPPLSVCPRCKALLFLRAEACPDSGHTLQPLHPQPP